MMATQSPQPSSVDDITKTASFKAVDDPNKLQGYASAPGVIDEVTRVVDHKAERRLCRRFDFRLLPILAIMCRFLSD
jgi:hypothetical protein